ALVAHRAGSSTADQDGATDVNVHQRVPCLGCELEKGDGAVDTGVVDERVDAAEVAEHRRHQRGARLGGADIGSQPEHFVRPAEPVGGGVDLVAVPGAYRDLVAVCQEPFRARVTNALAASSHQCDLVHRASPALARLAPRMATYDPARRSRRLL